MPDAPIAGRRARDAHDRVEHVPLADAEGGQVHPAVPEPLQARTRVVVRGLGRDFQAQQRRDAAAALGPSAGVDGRGAVVEEGDGAVAEVEAVEVGPRREAVLVPEAAGDADPGALAQRFDVRAVPGVFFADGDVLAQAGVGLGVAVLVGEDPRNIGGGGGVDEIRLLLWRGQDSHCDD